MDIHAEWREPFRKGVLYYLEGDIIRGVLLWNVWDKVDQAAALISRSIHEKDARIAF